MRWLSLLARENAMIKTHALNVHLTRVAYAVFRWFIIRNVFPILAALLGNLNDIMWLIYNNAATLLLLCTADAVMTINRVGNKLAIRAVGTVLRVITRCRTTLKSDMLKLLTRWDPQSVIVSILVFGLVTTILWPRRNVICNDFRLGILGIETHVLSSSLLCTFKSNTNVDILENQGSMSYPPHNDSLRTWISGSTHTIVLSHWL